MAGELDGKCVIVTGASSGIGAATARVLAGAGAAVVVAARRTDRLESLASELHGARIVVVGADMRKEADVVRMVATARERLGGVDLLVNNAGLGRAAPVSSGATEAWREMLEVNVLGLLIATREAIQDMDRRGVAGQIVNVSSMAGHRVPGPDSGVYSGTKFAVRAITEGLRQELRARKSAIRASCISPGYVETEFASVFAGGAASADETYRKMKVLEAADVARAVLWAATQPPHVEVHDVLMRPVSQRT